MKIASKSLCSWWLLLLLGLVPWRPVLAESADDLLEELRELREEVEKRRTELRQELQVLKEALEAKKRPGRPDAGAGAPGSMIQGELEELHNLQERVEKRRIQLHQELQVLKEALGAGEGTGRPGAGKISSATMTQEELEAELRNKEPPTQAWGELTT